MQGKHNYLAELQSLDEEIYKNMKYLKSYDGDVKDLFLTFSVDDPITG
jgi:ubiquitin-protein ligase E3 B